MTTAGPYKMGTISRLTGFSPILLRAWERRYELLQPERGTGGHRLYTDNDLQVLRRVRELIDSGRTIGEIAALGRAALLGEGGTDTSSTGSGVSVEASGYRLERHRAEIVQAALDLDAGRLNRALDAAAASMSFEALIQHVIEPAAREIGDLWQAGECTVASEHMASSVFVHRLRKLIESAESMTDPAQPFVIAACLPGEEHQLGSLILAYFLNRSGVRVLYLGSNLPFEDLRHACWATRPRAVLLSVTRKATYRRHRSELQSLVEEINHNTLFYLGGKGAPDHDPELEEVGLRLAIEDEAAEDAVRRVSSDITSRGRNRLGA